MAQIDMEEISFKDVLDALKDNIFRYLHVSMIAQVTDIDTTKELYTVSILPALTSEGDIKIQCKCAKGMKISVNDCVVVIFTDRANKNALAELEKDATPSTIATNGNLHDYANGIIVANLTQAGF